STALPPAVCAAAAAGIEVIMHEPERRERLWRLSLRLRNGMEAAGIEAVPGSMGPIVPVLGGDPERTVQIARRLEQRGFLVGGIRPPTVPARTSRLRITVSAEHSETAVDGLLVALIEELRPQG